MPSAERIAARENAADEVNGIRIAEQSDNVGAILVDLAQREMLARSEAFGGLILREGRGRLPFREDKVQSAAFAVLKSPDVPSVLFESGYINNPDEAARLAEERAELERQRQEAAERERIAAQERAAQEAKAQAAREAAEAADKARRDAEEKRLADERAELDHQRAEFQAEIDRRAAEAKALETPAAEPEKVEVTAPAPLAAFFRRGRMS